MATPREYTINPVVMPEESFGLCKNHRNCHTYHAWLAWGWCVVCYDRRVDGMHRMRKLKDTQ